MDKETPTAAEQHAAKAPKDSLCQAIEKAAGFTVATPADFDRLSDCIFSRTNVTVSTSTLKRLWGYAGLQTNPRRYTLDTLARFVGHKDYAAFEQTVGTAGREQSQLFLSNAITADVLEVGEIMQLTWLPDRLCLIEHLGGGRFRVVRAENTKLMVGDTFECHLFINHEPLYIDRLLHNGLPPISYVAGRQDGVMVRKVRRDDGY